MLIGPVFVSCWILIGLTSMHAGIDFNSPRLTAAIRLALRLMRSVPPRGSGWVLATHLSSRVEALLRTHPLPRGGTDLMSPRQLVNRSKDYALPL